MVSTYAVILAGGEGTRFAPYSTPEKPKQFLPIFDERKTPLQITFERLKNLFSPATIFVATNNRYISFVAEQIPEIPATHIFGEPERKNTAPVIALMTFLLARQELAKRDPEAVIFFSPADHYIHDVAKSQNQFKEAIQLAKREPVLVTLGVVPSFPSKEYGYIRFGKKENGGSYRVESFCEKPDLETATRYVTSGHYLWNSGCFVWRASVFMKALEKHLPDMAALLYTLRFPEDLNRFFKEVQNISIDYGVMEKADNIQVVPLHHGWSDVGTWQGLEALSKRYSLKLPEAVKRHLVKKILITLPTYNERENLELLCEKILSLSVEGANISICIIDDHSPDGTGQIADRLCQRYPERVQVIHRTVKLGLGSAIFTGFEVAMKQNYDFVINMDCDFSHNPEELPSLINAATANDLVIASRHIAGGKIVGWNWRRRALHLLVLWITRLILGKVAKDMTNSYKVYRVEMLRSLPLQQLLARSSGYVWHTLLINLVAKKGYKIIELPSTFVDRRAGYSKMSIREMLSGFWTLFQMRF